MEDKGFESRDVKKGGDRSTVGRGITSKRLRQADSRVNRKRNTVAGRERTGGMAHRNDLVERRGIRPDVRFSKGGGHQKKGKNRWEGESDRRRHQSQKKLKRRYDVWTRVGGKSKPRGGVYWKKQF